MNLDTGELKRFADAAEYDKFFDNMSPIDKANWVQIDGEKLTEKQKKNMVVEKADHRSSLAVQRDIIKRQKRSGRRRAARKVINDYKYGAK